MERLPLPSLLIPLPQPVFPGLRLCSDSRCHCFSSYLPCCLYSQYFFCLLCFSCTLCLSLGVFLPLSGSLSGFLTLSSSVYVSLPHPCHSLSNLVLIFSPSPCPSHSFRPASTMSGDILGPGALLPVGPPAPHLLKGSKIGLLVQVRPGTFFFLLPHLLPLQAYPSLVPGLERCTLKDNNSI